MVLSDRRIKELGTFVSGFKHSIVEYDKQVDRMKGYGLVYGIKDFDSFGIEPRPINIGPSSFDLVVGSHIVRSDTLVGSLTAREFFKMDYIRLEEGQNYVLEPNKSGENIYYFLTREAIKLPSNLELIVDARSTTGRVGGMCHRVGCTYDGERIIAVQPFTFPLKITLGVTSLAQAIIRKSGTGYIGYDAMTNYRDEIRYSKGGVNSYDKSLTRDGLLMRFATDVVYRAKDCDEPIDMNVKGEIDPKDYFEFIKGNSKLTIDARTLYLLGTEESIELGNICGRISRESDVSGTGLWSHFAGFIQSGFIGSITLEAYSLSKRVIKKGDPAGFILFDRVDGDIEYSYSGSYQHQKAPSLPKMFKPFEGI